MYFGLLGITVNFHLSRNGMEKLKAGIGTVADPESVDIQAK